VDRIPAEMRLSAAAQTSLRAHPASCTMSSVSFPWVMLNGVRSSDEVKERVELYFYSPFVLSWSVLG
jgi:hypothetical protein